MFQLLRLIDMGEIVGHRLSAQGINNINLGMALKLTFRA